MFSIFRNALFDNRKAIDSYFDTIEENFGSIFKHFSQAEESLKQSFVSLRYRIDELGRNLAEYPNIFLTNISRGILRAKQRVLSLERLMLTYNPERQLRLGYSIVRSGGSIIKTINQVKTDQAVDVMVGDGFFESEVKKIYKK